MTSAGQTTAAAGLRDAAIIALMYACGLRRAELVGLDLADLGRDNDVGLWLKIRHGKGNKQRRVPVTNGALYALEHWLSARGDAPGLLFVPIRKNDVIVTGRRLTPQAIFNLQLKRSEEVGIKAFSPHDMRRSFISDLLDAGADIETVSALKEAHSAGSLAIGSRGVGSVCPRDLRCFQRTQDINKQESHDYVGLPRLSIPKGA